MGLGGPSFGEAAETMSGGGKVWGEGGTPLQFQLKWAEDGWEVHFPSKKANECSSCPNIILSEPCTIGASYQCFLSVCAFTVCVWKCVAITAPLNLQSSVHKRVGTSSWSSFRVRLEFLKDTHPFYLLIQAKDISFNLFPCSSILPSITKTLGIFFWQWQGSLERGEKLKKKRIATHFWMNEERQHCNPG